MTMLNIPPSPTLPTYRTPPTLPLSFSQKWVATVNHRDDDFPAALLGIICPKSPRPTLPPAVVQVAPKPTANPEAVANVIYEQPTSCLVPTSTLKRHDAIEVITGKISRVGRVVGGVVFLDGGWSISAKNVPTVMLVHRATLEESEGVITPPKRKPEFFQQSRAATDPQCPAPEPPRVPIQCPPTPNPEPPAPTLVEAAEQMVGGRPAPKMVEKVMPGTQVIIFAGEGKDLSKYHLPPFASEREKLDNRRAIFAAMENGEITGDEANDLFDRNIEMRIMVENQMPQGGVMCLASTKSSS